MTLSAENILLLGSILHGRIWLTCETNFMAKPFTTAKGKSIYVSGETMIEDNKLIADKYSKPSE